MLRARPDASGNSAAAAAAPLSRFSASAAGLAAPLSGELGQMLSKVPEVTLGFWVIKILATTLGETGGDALSMQLNLGYLVSTAIFLAFFVVAVVVQVRARNFHPVLYWTVIVATTTAGTTLADFADRSLKIGYAGGSLLLLGLLLAVLLVWRLTLGSVSVDHITSPKVEAFYWATIFFSNTLGTALGDWLADTPGVGYERGALGFGVAIAVVGLLYLFTKLSRPMLFWLAFILTRPLGATLGDLLTKPHDHGGLELNRIVASLVLALLVAGLVWMLPQRAGRHPGHERH